MKMEIEIPNSMIVMLKKLFGAESIKNDLGILSESQYKNYLSKIIDELFTYLDENVQTDELHKLMLISGLCAAKTSLDKTNYYIGYIEGLIRFSLLLIGEYPEHQNRKGGRKRKNHYKLNLHRSIHYTQNFDQKFRTILSISNTGFPKLSNDPRLTLNRFRDNYGSQASYKDFVEWYRKEYPIDYSKIF